LPKFAGIIAVKPLALVQGKSVVDPLKLNTADAVATRGPEGVCGKSFMPVHHTLEP
jgi:hypothetical protein